MVDEIGPMEFRSALFRGAVIEALNSGAPVLATIVARSLPFAGAIRKRPDVRLMEIRRDNRERLVSELSDKFRS